ncbi:MAG: LPS export ABC transporter periplasmic protein LptC [Acidobacteriota bacterium]|nr:LPS export ABC transporter periplasmic protein LptC [Acidobacteriota bacterium]
MASWQKRAQLVLAVVAIGVIGVVGYTLRPRQARVAPPQIERLDPKATIETRGGDVIQLKGSRQDARIEFESQVTYDTGETKLVGVKVTVDNRAGRSYTITGQEARVGKDQASYDLKGDVKLETTDGLTAFAETATYSDTEKIVKAPGPVRFTRGRMSGKGIGFTFDEQRNTLWLLDQAVIHVAPSSDSGAMDVTAGAFGFARTDRYMRFERNMRMDRGGQIIEATEAMVHLFADRDEPDLIELRGNARVGGGTGMGALQSMSSRDMNLDYGDDGRTLQQATLSGQSQVQLAGSGGAAGQRLSGEFLDVALAPDGSVKQLSSRQSVSVTLPATRETSARTIRANVLTATGGAQGLSLMKFGEGVNYSEAASKTQGARLARAQSLDAQLDPAGGALQEATFTGAFHFTDGPLTATSNQARYQIQAGTLALSGKQGDADPQIKTEALTIGAETIDVTLNPRKMVAAGKVRSVLLTPGKPVGGATAGKRPGLLGDKEPVQIIAESLTYDEALRRGEYKGQASLLQGPTLIKADTLIIDEIEGNLTAAGKVMTTLALVRKDAEAGVPSPPTIGRGGSFTYTDQARRAAYQTAATLDGESGNLRAEKIEIVLAAGENSLERLDASEQVTAIVDKRTVTGARLSYVPAEEKYVVTGAPVTMIDAECQEMSGKTLTFFRASDKVQLDGNDEVRSQTKGGGKCVPIPPK